MATTDQELKQLNKKVSDAVNILKLYVGSTGQIKAKTEKEKEILEGWLNIVDMAEENQKRQRAFTDRKRDAHGRFIKKQDENASMFMKMASSVGKIFNKTAVGMTSAMTSIVKGITSHISNFFQQIKSQFISLFGEESEWFGILSSIKDSIVGFTGSIFNFLFKRTPAWASKQLKVMKALYALQVKQIKMEFLKAGGTTEKKVGIMGLLSALVFAIGASFGAFLHRKLKGMKILLSSFKLLRKIGQIIIEGFNVFNRLFKKLPLIGKYFKEIKIPKFGNIFGKKGKIGKIVKLVSTVFSKIPIIGQLLKGLKFGLKILGWPITILLSVIDFIKGFREEQGSLWDKIKNGLWEAFAGFIELPIKFIGWVIEKIAGWFGMDIKSGAIAENVMGNMEIGFKVLLDLPLKIAKGIKKAVDWVVKKIGGWKDKILNSLDPLINGLMNFFINFWNTAVDSWIENVPDMFGAGDKIKSMLEGLKIGEKKSTPTTQEPTRYSVAPAVAEYDRKKAEQRSKELEEAKSMRKDMWMIAKKNQQQSEQAINSMAAIQTNNMGNAGGDIKQIPDEIDNTLVSVNNHGGGFK